MVAVPVKISWKDYHGARLGYLLSLAWCVVVRSPSFRCYIELGSSDTSGFGSWSQASVRGEAVPP
jgi:hypothetical protein